MPLKNKPPPLEGVRVLELSSVIFGPLAGQVLGDLGADVIKIEGPAMDASRRMTPGPHPEMSGVALNLHRNKRSISLDLKQDSDREVLERLLGTADVLITNIRRGSLASLELTPESTVERHPRLIFGLASGFPSDGSGTHRPAVDDTMQAETGVADLAHQAGLGWNFMPTILADKVGGYCVAMAVLSALVWRDRHGTGQVVEVSMFDSALAFLLVEHLGGAAAGGSPGHARILTAARAPQRTKDGFIAMTPYTDRHWRELFVEVGADAEFDQPEFSSIEERHSNSAEVYGRLREIVSTRTTAEWVRICTRLDIPFGQVNELADLISDPSLHRGLIRTRKHGILGEYLSVNAPYRFSETEVGHRRDAPLIGEHTDEILHELGYGSDEEC